MPNPNKYSNKRIKYVDKSITELSQEAQKLQRSFWDSFIDQVMLSLHAVGKIIQDTDGNREIINSLGQLIDKDIRPGDGRRFLEWYVDRMDGLGELNEKYFVSIQLPEASQIQEIAQTNRKKLLGMLGVVNEKIKKGSFLYNLLDFGPVYNKLQGGLITTIFTGQAYDLKGAKEYIIGSRSELREENKSGIRNGQAAVATNRSGGAIEGAINPKTFDTFQKYDRSIQHGMAQDLNLKYAIYQGGLIKTSRPFCIERNDRVFSTEEIEKFGTSSDSYGGYSNLATGDFDGKREPYNPFIDLGCWNCRHHWDWISDELAEILRKDQKPVSEQKPDPKPIKPKSISLYVEANSTKESKKVTKALIEGLSNFKVSKISYSNDLSVTELNQRNKQIENLFSSYKSQWPDASIEVKLNSLSGSYGRVSSRGETLVKVNFGDKFDRARTIDFDKIDNYSDFIRTAKKSRVDEENIHISTLTHEFAHVIGIEGIKGTNEFWDKLRQIRTDYRSEVGKSLNQKDWKQIVDVYLGSYSGENLNEFMAEAFTEYKLRKNPSKYAKLVGELIDEYYSK